LEARALLTRILDFVFDFLEDTGGLFLRLDDALVWVARAFAAEGFRDETRANRGAFFLVKSFSLLESRGSEAKCSGFLPDFPRTAILAEGGARLTTVFSTRRGIRRRCGSYATQHLIPYR
jgi:hypothetical protein